MRQGKQAARKPPQQRTINAAAVQRTFRAGLQHHQAGRLAEAERLYREVLAADPRHADGLHLLGVVASQRGDHRLALDLIGEAIAIIPDKAPYHANLSQVFQALGRPEEAVACGRAAVALDPRLADAHRHLAHALLREGKAEAAATSFRNAVALNPDDADAQLNLGNLLFGAGRLDEAETCYRAARVLRPDDADAHNNLGSVLYRRGRLEAAEACCRQALALRPDHAAAHGNLGDILRERRQPEAAVEAYRVAIALLPDRAETHNNLGAAYLDLHRVSDAIGCFRTAIRLRDEDPDPHSNLAFAYSCLGRHAQAAGCARAAIRLRPDHPDAHINLAMALLPTGELAEGWREYEWRWAVRPGRDTRRDFAQPQWMGEPADARTLLVHAEQGLGDTLQFCRYLPLLRGRFRRVILEAPSPLLRLLRALPGVEVLVEAGAPLPPFELHCPLLSLPLALGTKLGSIPAAIPYLSADPAAAAAWRERLAAADGNGPRVGLAWAGSPRPDWYIGAATDRRRSLAPAQLAPMLDVPGVQFFSLQKGGAPAPEGFPLIDVMAEMRDFADTAALVANLDLVVSVDSAVAHLAGALGRPVCLLDRFDHCWRWLAGKRDSPWYPTMRIYRQPRPGDWDPVLAEMAGDLHSLATAWRAVWAETQDAVQRA